MEVPERLETLAGMVDLRSIPLSEPEGRLLLRFAADGLGLAVSTAVYERAADDCGPISSLRFGDERGRDMPVTASTRPDRVDLDIGGRPAVAAFMAPDLLMVRLPPGRLRLSLALRLDPGHTLGELDARADRVCGHVESAVAGRAFAWSVGARILGRQLVLDDAGDPTVALELECDGKAVLLAGSGPGAGAVEGTPDPDAALAAAAARWRRRLAAVPLPPGVPAEPVLRAAWVLATNTLSLRLDALAPAAVVPSKLGYVALWQWDAYFHAIGLRHLDPARARDQLRLALRWQTTDGMLPDVVHDDGVVAVSDDMDPADQERSLLHIGRKLTGADQTFLSAPLTKPPLTAWAAWKVYLADRDRSFLAEVYPAIVAAHRWWFAHSRPAGYELPIYLHPYSSGIDDSPLWDLGMPVETPDLPAYLALEADHLALMAEILGAAAAARAWRVEAAGITQALVARHWRAAKGAFVSFHDGREIGSDTVIGLLPIITGRLPAPVARRLVETLTDTERFWAPSPVPSVALADPDFEPSRMWRGPSWLFVDHLLVDGLHRSGFSDVAAQLRARTMRMVEQGRGMPEFFHPLTGARPDMATATFSGTAALYLDLALAPALPGEPAPGSLPTAEA